MRRFVLHRPPRLVRLGLAAVAVLTLALAGCGDPVEPTPSAPASTPSAAPSSTVAPTVAGGGSEGLTVRYLDDDGTVRTVGVEDFPR